MRILLRQYEGDKETYKSAEEIAHWKARDPLISYKARILKLDSSLAPQFEIFEKENKQLVIEAFEKASKDPFPTIDVMYEAVYSEEGVRA